MRYEYECEECGSMQEEFHGMMESPEINCISCESDNVFKSISGGAGFLVRTPISSKKIDKFKRLGEKKEDLKENYNVHDVGYSNCPFNELYKTIKNNGSLVKDQMDARMEISKDVNNKKRKIKNAALRKQLKKGIQAREKKAVQMGKKRIKKVG